MVVLTQPLLLELLFGELLALSVMNPRVVCPVAVNEYDWFLLLARLGVVAYYNVGNLHVALRSASNVRNLPLRFVQLQRGYLLN